MNFLKNAGKVFLYTFLLYMIFDFLICRKLLHWGFVSDSKEFTDQRYDKPYLEFTGKPLALDHNEMGYRGKSIREASDSAFKILFFGGSTGYYGNPTIAELLEKNLKKAWNKDVFVANCSVISSNHKQHVHALIEQFMNYKIDMVVFYGGYNENIQYLFYDPRPGYPFNYYYRHDCPRWRLNLIRYSAILGEIEKRHGIISGVCFLRNKYQKDEAKWYKRIEDTYFETLKEADKISIGLFRNELNQPCHFIGIYQPYKVNTLYAQTHEDIRDRIKDIDYLFDISDCLDSIERIKDIYDDDVHVKEQANIIIANNITDRIIGSYKSGE